MSEWPFSPPVATMEARVSERWPRGSFAYEPKWDGFRVLAWSGPDPRLYSRNQKPLLRYFPELEPALDQLPGGTVVDGEVVVVYGDATHFDALQMRIHPARSRITRLSEEVPAQLVAFDLLAVRGEDLRNRPFSARRRRLEDLAANLRTPWNLTPTTTDQSVARRWFDDYEAAGCDGVVAKRLEEEYVSGKRRMIKIKHRRHVDCVVGGYRVHKDGDKIGSLLLGLYNSDGALHFIGHCSGFSNADRVQILELFESLRTPDSFDEEARAPGAVSRWSTEKSMQWTPVQPGVVVEVSYDQLQNDRFRHATRFHRWRPDKPARECTMDQLERPAGPGFSEVVTARP
ncbi:MAG: ATP-dependent DNA ligase [bacterium]|nr:ATP-dependent DNA ligase [bacterium]